MRAGSEILDVAVEGRNGAGALGVGPGLFVCLFAGLLVERGNPLACFRHVRARSEILDVAVEGCGGTGADRFGPGLLVGVLARLLIRRGLLLGRGLLCVRLLPHAERSVAPAMDATTASLRHTMRGRNLGSRGRSAFMAALLSGLHAPLALFRVQYVPKYSHGQKIGFRTLFPSVGSCGTSRRLQRQLDGRPTEKGHACVRSMAQEFSAAHASRAKRRPRSTRRLASGTSGMTCASTAS